MLDLNKPIKTKDGLDIIIHYTSMIEYTKTIYGEVCINEYIKRLTEWDEEGKNSENSKWDLVNVRLK